MLAVKFHIPCGVLGLFSALSCWGAGFGTVVPITGTVSDIALDERRNVVWAANFSAYRVEQVHIPSQTLLTPLSVPMPPSAVAMSPDHRFLVVGEYQKPDPVLLSTDPFAPETGGYTLFDLDAGLRYDVNLNSPVLAVAFGSDGNAVILTRTPVNNPQDPGPLTNLFVLQPFPFQTLTAITSIPVIQSVDLPVPLVQFPTQIGQATAGISGDKNTIVFLAAADKDPGASSQLSVLIRYNVPTQSATAEEFTSSPPAGPRTVSVDQTGANVLADWILLHFLPDGGLYSPAQFPQANGAFQTGSHAWDLTRGLIYAQIPTPDDTTPVLHVMATDNLTVSKRLQLSENLSGKSQMSSDGQAMYSASASGVTILPIGQLPNLPQVGYSQEDMLFAADACNQLVLQQGINIISLSSVNTDFSLSLPDGINGVKLSATSGTTPAQVTITIDPSAFQGSKGTTSIPLTLTSNGGVNLPAPMRLLINTRDFNQRGQIVNIPGKLVDILTDQTRSRLYVLRQDQNVVLVYDAATLQRTAFLRTGTTPTQMAISADRKYLLIGNENSQIANVFDLDTLQDAGPIIFPGGHYPRSIGVAKSGIFAVSRLATDPPECTPAISGAATLDTIDLANRVAVTPCTLSAGAKRSIYQNGFSTIDGVLTPTAANDYLLLALADGTVIEYDDSVQSWVASRKDLGGVGGAYAAFSRNLFLVGPNLFDAALVPLGQPFPATDGTSSGVGVLSGAGLRTTATAPNGPGIIQRINLTNRTEYNATLMAEAPMTASSLLTPTVGQIGESILPFTRTLAISPDQTKIFALTTSGLTVLPSTFDAILAKPVVSSVVNAADLSRLVATGGTVDINGAFLSTGSFTAGAPPLPESLGDVCALVNDIPLPLFSVSPGQLVAQLPYISGAGSLVVHNSGGVSAPFGFTIQGQAPAIYQTSGVIQVIRDDNAEPVGFTNPIHPNTALTIYVTGLGLTTPLPPLGTAAPDTPPALVNTPPTVTLGGVSLAVSSSSLVPGKIGVYTIHVTAPAKVQVAESAPLTVTAGGNSATYNVRVVSP